MTGRGPYRNNKIAAHKAEVEELTCSMQKFCLIPNEQLYHRICNCSSLRRNTEGFEYWQSAVVFMHSYDTDQPDDVEDFLTTEAQLCEKAILAPTKSVAIKVINMFFGTGKLKYIDLFYQIMGHERITQSTRSQLSEIFRNTKELYTNTLLTMTPDQQSALSVDIEAVNFTYFDGIADRAKAEKERIALQLINKHHLQAITPPSF